MCIARTAALVARTGTHCHAHFTMPLVWKNDKTQWDWRKVIKWSSLIFSGHHAQYHLPYHKTDPFYHGTGVLFNRHDIADPVSLLHDYVTLRDQVHRACAALFIHEDGSIPMRAWWDKKFFALLDKSFGGHSARAGGATYYASLGLSESIIQAIGRWSSQAWKIYICGNPTIRAEQQLASLQFHSHHN